MLERNIALLLSLPNLGVIGVWFFTLLNQDFLYTQESVPVFNLTICGGLPYSLIVTVLSGVFSGVRVFRIGHSSGHPTWGWWLVCLGTSVGGGLANVLGFFIGMGGGG